MKGIKTVTLRLVCVVRIFVFKQQKMRHLDVLWGVWPAGGVHVLAHHMCYGDRAFFDQ